MKKNLLISIGAALLLVLNVLAFSSSAGEPIPTHPLPTGCYQTAGYCSLQIPPVLTYLCEPRVSGIVKCTVNKPSTCSGEHWCIFPLVYPPMVVADPDPEERSVDEDDNVVVYPRFKL